MLAKDAENEFNGFLCRRKIGRLILHSGIYGCSRSKGYGGSSSSVAFPSSTQSSYWIEGTIGGRVQLFDSNFYIDVNLRNLNILPANGRTEIQPMIVRDSAGAPQNLVWVLPGILLINFNDGFINA